MAFDDIQNIVVVAVVLMAAAMPARAQGAGPLDCRAAASEGVVRPYDPSLRPAAMSAFHARFPRAATPPSEAELSAGSSFRCMGGRMLVCFVGANLPCGRMNVSRENAGATEFCRGNAQARDVPMVATGHDTIYAYRCDRGRAVIARQIYHVDPGGYAREVWIPAGTP